jgi:hypothetical protein
MTPDQLGFDFSATPQESGSDGLARWRAARREAMEALALKQGLPLGQRVRVEFECGPPLEGTLVLNEEALFISQRANPKLHLRIGTSDFHADEIAACVRID